MLLVVQLLPDDDVQPSAGKSGIGSRSYLQPMLGAHAPPRQPRVDGDDLRPHLHALHQPVAHVAVGVRRKRLVAPHHQHLRRYPLGVAVAVRMRLGRVHDGEVAERRDAAADARHVAGKAGKAEGRDVGRLQACLAEERHLPVDVAPGSVHADDGVAAVRLPNAPHPFLDLVVCLVPRDALPLVLAALSGAPHGVLQAVGMVQGLVERQAFDAELAVRARIQRIALHAPYFAVLGIDQDAA